MLNRVLDHTWFWGLTAGQCAVTLALLAFYVRRPAPQPPGRPAPPTLQGTSPRAVATALYALAGGLGLLRLPYTLVPYLAKSLIWPALPENRLNAWNAYPVQAVRLLGDFANFWLTTAALLALAAHLPAMAPGAAAWVYVCAAGEYARLCAEKLPVIASGLWQIVPHRRIARRLRGSRYAAYYALPDAARLAQAARWLRALPRDDPGAAAQLDYFGGFRVVPDAHALRAGRVRDVATGEVFVHAAWSADPWLLIGTALRRTPWFFDPRYLRRPFRYRTEANRLATLFVLEHAGYSPPYALYQFGHQIKAARHEWLHALRRALGRDVEEWVREDGTAAPERLLRDLCAAPAAGSSDSHRGRPLWSGDEAARDVLARYPAGDLPGAEELAARYTFPMKYVEEVFLALLPLPSPPSPERKKCARSGEGGGG
jgi:hypothetical protein